MLCVVKATLQNERRRFTLATVDPSNIRQSTTADLSYKALHLKLCELFGQANLTIYFNERTGAKKLLRTDEDVLSAITSSAALAPPNTPMVVMKLTAEPAEPPVTSVRPLSSYTAPCSSHSSIQAGGRSKSPCSPAAGRLILHPRVFCDACLTPIRGVRHKCLDCDNYDLCQACRPRAESLHRAGHTLKAIDKPTECHRQSPRSAFHHGGLLPLAFIPRAAKNFAHLATCDLCTVAIVGIRHKCFQCPDYDLCEECLPLARIHHPRHDFVPISFPGQISVKLDKTPHVGVICDGCEGEVNGIRYKCGNCPDFDLCGNCEASPIPVHDPSHIMLKIRKPIKNRTGQGRPLLPMMYQKGRGSLQTTAEQRRPQPLDVEPKLEMSAQTSILKMATPQPMLQVRHESEYEAAFVKDINLHDGTVIQAGSQFLKIWEMSNPGPNVWPKDTRLQFVGGDRMANDLDMSAANPGFKIELADVGESVCVSADLRAPAHPGRYVSYWRLVLPSGEPFGHRVWCDILVEEGSESSSDSAGSSTMIFPLVDCTGEQVKSAWSRTESNLDADEGTAALSSAGTTTFTATTITSDRHATTASLTDDQLSNVSSRYMGGSVASSVLGYDESVGSQDDDADFVVISRAE